MPGVFITRDVKKIFGLALWALLFLLLGRSVWFHWQIVHFPYPLDSREGAMLFSTQLLALGINPFNFQLHPQATNVYGIVYPLLAAPFCHFGYCGLGLHRFLSAACLVLSSLLLVRASRRLGTSLLLSLWLVEFFYMAQLLFTAPDARPDQLGLLFFLAALLLPQEGGYRWPILILGACLALLAFYTKPYFGLAGPLLAAGLWFHGRRLRAVIFALGWGLAFLISLLWMQRHFEAYFYDAFLHHRNIASYELFWMLTQIYEFFLMFRGLAILMAWAGFSLWFKKKKLPAGNLLPYVSFCALLSILIFVFKLGGHVGAELTYLLQLFAPFFLLLAGVAFSSLGTTAWAAWFLIGWCAWSLGYQTIWLGYTRPQQSLAIQSWNRAWSVLQGQRRVLASGELAPLLLARGLAPPDTGQTEYFVWAGNAQGLEALFPRTAEVLKRSDDYASGIEASLLRGEFDLVMTHPGYLYFPEALKRKYKLQETLRLPLIQQRMVQEVEVYVRR